MFPRHIHPQWLWAWSLLGLAFSAGLILEAYWPASGLFDRSGQLIGRDFVNVWMTSKLLYLQQINIAYDIPAFIAAMRQQFGLGLPFHNWSYPPGILPFLIPFGRLPYPISLALFSMLGLIVFRMAARPKNSDGQLLWPAWLLVTSPAAIVNLLSGQNGFFSAACFLGGFKIMNRHPVMAGILFGLLTVKPHLGIIIPFVLLLLGQWRTIFSAAVTSILLVIFSIGLWGTGLWQDYFQHIAPYQQTLLTSFHGFYTFLMPGSYAAARVVGLSHGLAMVLHLAIAFVASVASLSVVKREGASPRAVLALAIAAMLITPYGYNYDLTIVTAALLGYVLTHPVTERESILFGILWMLPGIVFALMFAHLPLAPLCLVAPLLYLAHQSAHPRRDSVRIVPFTPARAPYFDRFNREWIARFFWLEPYDLELLTRPDATIIEPGGEVWFAEEKGKVLATCALLKSAAGMFEFSKLGVAEQARGRGISRTLLHHCMYRARLRGAHTLRIFTHSSLTTACTLYRAEGFRDVPIPDEEKSRYQRADTLLLFDL